MTRAETPFFFQFSSKFLSIPAPFQTDISKQNSQICSLLISFTPPPKHGEKIQERQNLKEITVCYAQFSATLPQFFHFCFSVLEKFRPL